MADKIIEVRDLPEGDKVYVKKDWFGWRIVQPLRNEDGSINYMNLLVGGKRNFFTLVLILVILLTYLYGTSVMNKDLRFIAAHPCEVCSKLTLNATLMMGDDTKWESVRLGKPQQLSDNISWRVERGEG